MIVEARDLQRGDIIYHKREVLDVLISGTEVYVVERAISVTSRIPAHTTIYNMGDMVRINRLTQDQKDRSIEQLRRLSCGSGHTCEAIDDSISVGCGAPESQMVTSMEGSP